MYDIMKYDYSSRRVLMVRKIVLITFITLLFSTFLSFLMDPSIDQYTWANSLFYCSLLLTIIGGVMLVLQGGFFNGIVRSFKEVLQKSSKVGRVLDEIEGKDKNTAPYSLTFTLTTPILLAGILLLGFSIIFSWVISF